jgi:hypothetical protein
MGKAVELCLPSDSRKRIDSIALKTGDVEIAQENKD